MQKITDLTQIGLQSLTALGESFMSSIPNILGALFLLLLGWAVAKVISYIIRKTLTTVRFDKFSEKLNVSEILRKANIHVGPSTVVSKFAYWLILLLFFVTASDTLGWHVVSESISDLLTYLPKLFSGAVIFVIGFYVATFVKKGLRGILESLAVSSARLVSGFAFYVVVTIITLTALNQAGINTEIITSNVTLIIGGIVLAFVISFGFGARDILTNILSSFYSKSNFQVGQQIELGEIIGTIEKIDITSCVIRTDDRLVIIPVKRLLSENVTIRS